MPEVESKTVSSILALVERERNGEDVNCTLLQQAYAELFERQLLRETEGYYRKEGVRYMSSTDVPNYLQHSERRLQE
ncbi:unnamed protein product, partial [Discosporangium mesarthrocarpum]